MILTDNEIDLNIRSWIESDIHQFDPADYRQGAEDARDFYEKQTCDKCIHNHMCMVVESMMKQFNVSKNELDKIGCNRFED
jgi:hypothetical protein